MNQCFINQRCFAQCNQRKACDSRSKRSTTKYKMMAPAISPLNTPQFFKENEPVCQSPHWDNCQIKIPVKAEANKYFQILFQASQCQRISGRRPRKSTSNKH